MATKITKKVAKKTTTTTPKTSTTTTVGADINKCTDVYSLIASKYSSLYGSDVTKEEVTRVWNAFQEAFVDYAKASDADKAKFLLPNLGVMTIKVVAAHQSINPRTGDKIDVPAKKRVSFRPFPRLSKEINE